VRVPPAGRVHPAWSIVPRPLITLIGRERDVAEAAALLERNDVRLLTLVGPGGVGKTRLALHLAERAAATFADGVAVVGLAPIRDPALVLQTIAQTLDLREIGGEQADERLRSALRDRALLLVLDNVGQVVDAGLALADRLVACPRLKIVATSRAVLQVSGERISAVPPLSLGRGDGETEGRRGRDDVGPSVSPSPTPSGSSSIGPAGPDPTSP
jgi:predicted ATPase